MIRVLPTSNFHPSSATVRSLRAAAAVWVGALVVFACLSEAGAQPAGDTSTASGPIQITADELVSRIKDNFAEFSGNVEAVQGDFVIRSDRLRIHYRRAGGQPALDPTGNDAIERIEAIGHVRITSGTRQARTELAEYLVDEGLVVLKGENSTVTDGNNSIRGSVIKLNRLDGKISVEGGPTERVRAVFHSTGKGPNTGDKDKSQ